MAITVRFGFDPPAVTPGNPTYPNMPAGLIDILNFDGSVKHGGTGGTHAFGHDSFGSWGGDPANIVVVDDPTNPSGSGRALQFTYPAGSDAGSTTANTFGGPFRRIYLLYRILELDGMDSFGHKFWYFGAALGARHTGEGFGSPTQFYSDIPGAGSRTYRLVNQNVGSVVINRSDRPPPEGGNILLPAHGTWITIEHIFEAESAPGAGDGRGAMFIDGEPAGDRSNVVWNPAGASANGFDGIQYYAVANTVPETATYRLGELKIAGELY